MKFVGLVSGGKDSIFSLAVCMSHRHELVALANLYPPASGPDELDSFMFQSAGHSAVEALGECLGVPMVRAELRGNSGHQGLHYDPTAGDEVEDLFELIKEVKARYPDVEALASGAVLSTYQRTRVESVCARLGLTSLGYLWQRSQGDLLDEMLEFGMHAIVVKVASAGLKPSKHLGKSLGELLPTFKMLEQRYQFHVAGEGGEYETLTLDCPIFKKRLVLDRTEAVIENDDVLAPVGHLNILQCHTEDKDTHDTKLPIRPRPSVAPRPTPPPAHPPAPPALPSPPLPLLSAPLVRRGMQVFSSGIKGSDRQRDAAQQVLACLRRLCASLAAHGLGMPDVAFVHLYLSSMADFGDVNAAYCQSFGDHPPSRSCVEAPLPPGCKVLLDAVAIAGSGQQMRQGNYTTRKVLHVRSLSEWAPVCIGPYSQANTLVSHLHLLAGQIALHPPTMLMDTGGLVEEVRVSLGNVGAVLSSLQSSMRQALLVIAYVRMPPPTNDGQDPTQEPAPAWADVVSAYEDACRALPSGGEGEVSSGEEDNGIESDDEEALLAPPPPLVLLGVPDLPRHAAVEFEVVALSRLLSRALPPHTCTHTTRRPLTHFLPLASPLPEPFQPPLPPHVSDPAVTSEGPTLACTSHGSFLSHVLCFAQVTLAISWASEASEEGDRAISLLDSEYLATAIREEVDRLLSESSVTRQQLMHVRGFFPSTGPLSEEVLHESLSMALGGTSKTLVPVSSLAGMQEVACPPSSTPSVTPPAPPSSSRGSYVMLTLQLTALDLERLRTEAWVHAVPRPQL